MTLLIVKHPIRFLTRGFGFFAFAIGAITRYAQRRLRGPLSHATRAEWMQGCARRLATLLHVEIQTIGTPPSHGLIAANHLSYLDIIVIASVAPGVFVSKNEVRYWPLIGLLSTWSGTLYLKRTQRSDVARINRAVGTALQEKRRVIVFPEGTSSDGRQVLPFHASLFSPAVTTQSTTTPCRLRYQEPGNDPEHRICYWGDMLFLTHFLNLLCLERIQAELRFFDSLPPATHRKQLAADCYELVSQPTNQIP